MTLNSAPQWQLVLILWGTKYPVAEVNHLIETVLAHAAPAPARIVLLSDRARAGLHPDVQTGDIPAFFLQDAFRQGGCQTKLCMFEQGVVPDDMPAIYIDIDTVVFGNLARLLSLRDTPAATAILPSAILPFGAFARALARLSKGRHYARGNSSIVVYHPAECTYVARRFREMIAAYGYNGKRPMVADERFLSWAHQPHMRAIPRHLAVKFPTEFMLPWRWLILVRARLPWLRKRWAGLIAVTLPGVEVKGEALLALADGAEITDRKGRKLIWSEAALGPVKARLADYYQHMQSLRGPS